MVRNESIVVTGMGVAAAAGQSSQDLWRAVLRGISPAVAFSDPTSPGSPTIPACVVQGPDAAAIGLRRSHRMDRCVRACARGGRPGPRRRGFGHEPSGPLGAGRHRGHARGPMQKWTESLDLARSGSKSHAADPGGQQYARRPQRCALRGPECRRALPDRLRHLHLGRLRHLPGRAADRCWARRRSWWREGRMLHSGTRSSG